MAYTYVINTETFIVDIYDGPTIVDSSGPWESYEAGAAWVSEFTQRLNAGQDTLETNVE